MKAPIYVRGAFAFTDRASLEAWPDGPVTPIEKPDLTLLDRSLRRGLSDVTRLFMHAAYKALLDAEMLGRSLPVVFGSAFGEIATAEAMLAQAYEENTASPIRFRHSVHNTAEGLYSISSGNQEAATAIAAGWDTVAMGVLEAATQLACGAEQILVVFAEERVPLALSAEHNYGPMAAAFVLAAADGPHTRAVLQPMRQVRNPTLPDPFGSERHPLGPALCLARAVAGTAREELILGEGPPTWVIDVEPRARP